ncbi:STAS domain-containing protein [Mycobacterium sp. 23]|uniref:STAS domain-containing protein n=1 Tax=Mycobacterium sp. 23 TaxID=3400424 RepID=UPI003AB035C6
MTNVSRSVMVAMDRRGDSAVLRADGVLDSSTYQGLRDSVIKAALDEPKAVIVDVNGLAVPSPSAWSVFTSARWHVNIWPDVPIMLVSSNIRDRRAIASCGVARYVPVHPTCDAALVAADDFSWHSRRRGRAELPRGRAAMRLARSMIDGWLTAWSCDRLIPVAGTVATVFIENVLEHTDSAPVLIVESCDDTVTVAVEDCSHRPAIRHEDTGCGADLVSGLAIVSVLSRAWGSTPTSSGKTVWALVGSENRL